MERILNHEKAHQKYFKEMTAIPYDFYHEQAYSVYLVAFAREHELKWIQDELYSIIIYKDASASYEDHAPVLLQAHTNMIYEKDRGTDFDFEENALKLYIKDGFPKAKGTTPGTDDGVGVAYMLALLSDPGAKYPPLECVFTVQGEVKLFGAVTLGKGYFQAKRIINLDDGGENAACTTSAGGVNVIMQKERILVPHNRNGYQIDMFGLHGGHFGGEIGKEHGNTNKLLARILFTLNRWYGIQLSWIQGGIEDNAIPRKVSATFVCQADLETITACIQETKTIFAKKLELSDADVDVVVREVACDNILCIEDSEEVITLLMTLPNGLHHHSVNIERLSTTSNNIGIVTTQEEAVIINTSLRGAAGSYVDTLAIEADTLTEVFGFHSEHETRYPAQSYRTDSPMRECLKAVCQKVLGKELQLVAAHGDLECGVFKTMDKDMDIVTIGPKMQDIHTPQEALGPASFGAAFTLLGVYPEEL